jgi:hypothetical protein
MFWIDIVRSCGHQEKVLVKEGLNPQKPLPKALDELERALSSQPCTTCQQSKPVEEPQEQHFCRNLIILLVILVMVFLSFFTSQMIGPLMLAWRTHQINEKYGPKKEIHEWQR